MGEIMVKNVKTKINAIGNEITIISDVEHVDYISLTDIAKYKSDEFPGYIIQNWLRNRNTVEFLGFMGENK